MAKKKPVEEEKKMLDLSGVSINKDHLEEDQEESEEDFENEIEKEINQDLEIKNNEALKQLKFIRDNLHVLIYGEEITVDKEVFIRDNSKTFNLTAWLSKVDSLIEGIHE